MDTKNIENYLKSFGQNVVDDSKALLKKEKGDTALGKWIKSKGIKGRDKKSGRFISNLSLAFIIGRKIKRDGIKSLSFFQKPLGLGMKQFGKNLLGAITTDITETISQTQVN